MPYWSGLQDCSGDFINRRPGTQTGAATRENRARLLGGDALVLVCRVHLVAIACRVLPFRSSWSAPSITLSQHHAIITPLHSCTRVAGLFEFGGVPIGRSLRGACLVL